MGRKEEAAKALSTAFDKANAIQLYVYARGLQRQGQQDKPFELYKLDAKRYPNHWISHLAMARVDSKAGDFTAASKEMKLSIDGAPEQQKTFLAPLLKRLEAKDDINK